MGTAPDIPDLDNAKAREVRMRAPGTVPFKFLMNQELRDQLDKHRGELSLAEFIRHIAAQYFTWLDDAAIQTQMGLFTYLDFSRSVEDIIPPELMAKVNAERGERTFSEFLADVVAAHIEKKEKRRRGRKRLHHT